MVALNYLKTRKLLYILFGLVFLQSAFVISIAGGTFKWYEIISFLLLVYLFFFTKKIQINKISFLLLLLFVLSPIISDLYSCIIKPFERDVYRLYYSRFPEAQKSLRCNFIFSTVYSLSLSLGVFSILYFLINSSYIYNHQEKVTKLFIYCGTIVAIYSLYQFFAISFLGLPDIVPSLLDHRNFKGEFGNHRVGGFSIEPGSYIFIQSIVVITLIFERKIFSRSKRFVFIIINVLALLFTMSSSIIIFFCVIVIYILIFSKNRFARWCCILGICLSILVYPLLNNLTNNTLKYTFITKLHNYTSYTGHTLDSGAMRAFTKRIGYRIFFDHPLFGCGFGNSFFYMPLYEYDMGIEIWGERLNPSMTPQNNFSKILAEQGIFGIISFLLFFYYSIKEFYKYREDKMCLMYLIISILLLGYNFTGGVYLTNLFIWLNLGLGLNYRKYKYGKTNFHYLK